eukprot:GHVT01022933.1.p1 GENE.GHVT01022933.1~~GHVT01022933.1.p1  ORF type:complete len:336 (-),score=77.21 GHVT01022933.1:967-1974(-)
MAKKKTTEPPAASRMAAGVNSTSACSNSSVCALAAWKKRKSRLFCQLDISSLRYSHKSTKRRRTDAFAVSCPLNKKLDFFVSPRTLMQTVLPDGDTANPIHMVGDKQRVKLYQEAITATASNKHVLEIGTGPFAMLAINAMRAGAADVTALEVSAASCAVASAFVDMYGFANIQVVNAYSKFFPLSPSSKIDLLIHEIIDDFAGNKGVADVVLDIQQRTKSIPKSIPFAARSFITPVSFPCPRHIQFPHDRFPQHTILSPRRRLLQTVDLQPREQLMLSEQYEPFEVLEFEKDMLPQMVQKRDIKFGVSRKGRLAGLLMTKEVEVMEVITLHNFF